MINTPMRFQPDFGFARFPEVIDQWFRDTFLAPTRFERFFDKRMCNLLETPASYVVQLALPGIDLDKLAIQVLGRQLTVKASVRVPPVENATYLWNGFVEDEFSEVYTLPMDVRGEKAVASYEAGVLTITLPKVEHALPKEIKVSVKK